jgi:AcrR family transcriptional regulator
MKHTERRAAILDAAAAVFAAIGYEGATTARLATAAGVTEPVLYRHFRDKEQLYCQTLEWAAEQTLADWAAISRGISNSREQLLAITAVNQQLSGANASHYAVLLAAPSALGNGAAIRQAVQESFARLEHYLSGLVSRGQERGELRRDVSPTASAWTLLSLSFAQRLTHELTLQVSGDRAWEFGAGSRYLDTLT